MRRCSRQVAPIGVDSGFVALNGGRHPPRGQREACGMMSQVSTCCLRGVRDAPGPQGLQGERVEPMQQFHTFNFKID